MDGVGRELEAVQARNGRTGRNDAISGRRPDARSRARAHMPHGGKGPPTVARGSEDTSGRFTQPRRPNGRASCASFPECDGLLCDFAAAAAAKSDVINGVARGGGGDGDDAALAGGVPRSFLLRISRPRWSWHKMEWQGKSSLEHRISMSIHKMNHFQLLVRFGRVDF